MTAARTICLGFLAVITVGTLLLWMPAATTAAGWDSLLTALFTSTSAVCVTGLSVVDIGEHYTGWGQLVLLLLVQVGGLGYMTATTFLLLVLGRRFGLRDRVALQQSLDTPGMAGVQQLVKSIVGLTLVVELTGVFVLIAVFAPTYGFREGVWLALFHSINSFNNAGFSLFSTSYMDYVDSPLLVGVVTLLIMLGGVGYQALMELIYWARSLRWRRNGSPWMGSAGRDRVDFSLNFKMSLSTSVFLWIVGTLAFLAAEFNNPHTLATLDPNGKFLAAWFQSVTTRTAGFNTIDIGAMTSTGLFLTMALMFIGASPGSTGGGIKTTTLRILVNCTESVLRGKEAVLVYQRQVPLGLVLKAIAVFMGSIGTVIVATTLLTIGDPALPFQQLLFEVVSAFATVGLSTGITGSLSLLSKAVIIVTMYIGRVGVLLLMAAIVGNPGRSVVRYPEEDLLVG